MIPSNKISTLRDTVPECYPLARGDPHITANRGMVLMQDIATPYTTRTTQQMDASGTQYPGT